jgi:hypothetical protein
MAEARRQPEKPAGYQEFNRQRRIISQAADQPLSRICGFDAG